MVFLILACTGDPVPEPEGPDQQTEQPEDSDEPVQLDTLDVGPWAARASLDLRGKRIEPDVLAEIEADPDTLAQHVDAWIAEPDFAERMAWRYNDRLRVATHFVADPVRMYEGIDDETRLAMAWEPLELVRMVIADDLAFTQVVTAEWLPRHPLQAQAYGWQHGGTDWEPYGAPDTRPMAGILSSTGFWLRYDGDRNNFQRRRANAVARIFLCADFLDRDTSFEFDLAPEDLQDMEQAIVTDPACTTCHAALDPLGANLGGFAERSVEGDTRELAVYSAHDEAFYRGWRQPAYFGERVGDLADLGQRIATDHRFARCATQTFAEGLLGRELRADDPLDAWTQAFTDGGQRVSVVAREVVLSDAYGESNERSLQPDQLDAVLRDLGLDEDAARRLSVEVDLKVLAGGTDDDAVLARNAEPSLGHHLALAWAGRELAETYPEPSGDTRDGLAELHRTFLSREATDAELDALEALHASAGHAGVVEALVRHPEFLLY